MIVPRLTEGLTNPFGNGYSLLAGKALYLSIILLIEKDVQSLLHIHSVLDSF